MKKTVRFILIAVFVMMTIFAIHLLYADPPSPPSVPGGHGSEGNVPEGAPFDGGLILLFGMGLIYGVKILLKAEQKRVTTK